MFNPTWIFKIYGAGLNQVQIILILEQVIVKHLYNGACLKQSVYWSKVSLFGLILL